MDRKTKRKLRRELKKMSWLELAGLVNALAMKDDIENDLRNNLRYVNHINLKKED